MGSFTFTATESLLPSRVYGEVVTLEIDVQDGAKRGRQVFKDVQRTVGRAMEVLKHGADETYSIPFEPVCGRKLDELREMLASTEGGEEFTADLYGNAAAPLRVKRLDEGYDEQVFMRRGAENLDYVQITIQVLVL